MGGSPRNDDQYTRQSQFHERVVAYESSRRVLPQPAGPNMSGTMELGQRAQSSPNWVMRRKLLSED
jgi:hypothetical protein